MPLSVRKMSLQIVQRLSQTNAKTSCLDPTPGHYDTAKRGNFLLQEEVDGINWIKTPKSMRKQRSQLSKSIIHSFHAVMWSMDHR